MDIKNLTNQEKDDLRRQMGTLPEMNTENKTTTIHCGVEGISVEMFDKPTNYAKVIVEYVCSTWGNEQFENKTDSIVANRRRQEGKV